MTTSSNWTDETKEKAVKAYLDRNPTPETSMDIVKELSEEFEVPPNSLRMVLSQAQVYVKKTDSKSAATKTSSASKDDGDTKTRRSKQTSLDELTEAITSAGQTVDDTIISKLTGKAADYFTGIIQAVNK